MTDRALTPSFIGVQPATYKDVQGKTVRQLTRSQHSRRRSGACMGDVPARRVR